MEKIEIVVENISCGGCETSIKKGLLEIPGVAGVDVMLEAQKITVRGEKLNRDAITKKLDGMGYTKKGNNSFMKEVKSYVSCAIGKVSGS